MERTSSLTVLLFLAGCAAQAQTARVQVIHNSADAAASTVDVYLNGNLLLDDFAFRTATPFIDAPAGVDLSLAVAPSSSMSVADAIYTQDLNLMDGATYVVVADGIVSGSGYAPAVPFNLEVYPMGREASAGGSSETDVLVHHGSTDAPTVDVYESTVVNATIVEDAAYPGFAGYLELPTADYGLQVRDEYNSAIVAAYSAPLSTLGLGGAALVVVASGFLDPSLNSDGPAFGLYAALASGGPLVALPEAAIPTARVQVIHNCADLAAAQVDVWLNNGLLLDDFAFRTASPFVDAQAGVPFDVSIAAPNSMDTVGALARFTYTLDADGTYILVANGIVSSSGYDPIQPFDIHVLANARETSAQAGNVDVLVFHGCTDAPTVDVVETAIPAGTIVEDISYGEFAGYLELGTNDYVLQIENMGTPVATFQAPLSSLGLAGNALTVLASGFLTPSNNSGGPSFGLWAATAAGGPLLELPVSTDVQEASAPLNIQVGPNPTSGPLWIAMDMERAPTRISVLDASGRIMEERDMGVINGEGQRILLDLSRSEPGVYVLRLSQGEVMRTVRVQKF